MSHFGAAVEGPARSIAGRERLSIEIMARFGSVREVPTVVTVGVRGSCFPVRIVLQQTGLRGAAGEKTSC